MPVTDPESQYWVVRRMPNGSNRELGVFSITDWSQTQLIREVALQAARQNRTNNPAWRILIYGPTNGGPHTEDDIVWDSATDL